MMQVDDRYTAAAWIADGHAVEFIAETLGASIDEVMNCSDFRPSPCPTPKDIAVACHAIRSGWTIGTRLNREGFRQADDRRLQGPRVA